MMVIKTVNAYGIQDMLTISVESADIFLINYHKVINFATFYAMPEVIGVLKYLSEKKNCALFLCAKLNVEDERYYSTIVFDKGRFLGIADAITEAGYEKGKSQKIFTINGKRIGVCVGCDFLYGSVDNQYLCGADMIVHLCNEDFNVRYYGALKAKRSFCPLKFISFYKEDVFLYDFNLKRFNVGDKFNMEFDKENKSNLNGLLKVSIIE